MPELTTSKKRKFILTKLTSGSSNYWGKFPAEGREIALCDNPKRVVFGPNYKAEDIPIKYSFSKDYPMHSIEVDLTDKKEAEFIDYFKRDSRVFVKGPGSQMNSGHIYELIDVNGDEINKALEIKKRGKLTGLIYSMPLDELVKTCYYFNANITGKSKEAIYALLLHWETGYLFRSMKIGGKDVVPMDVILSEGFGAEFEIRTAVNKAIITNVIKNRGGVYFLGDLGTPLGSTPDQVYAFMQQNKPIFDGSLQYLLKDEQLPESIDYSGEIETVQADFTAATEIKEKEHRPFKGSFSTFEREEYEKEAKELEVQGHIAGFKDETLYNKVMERRIYLASKKK